MIRRLAGAAAEHVLDVDSGACKIIQQAAVIVNSTYNSAGIGKKINSHLCQTRIRLSLLLLPTNQVRVSSLVALNAELHFELLVRGHQKYRRRSRFPRQKYWISSLMPRLKSQPMF
jgi:hypothetical protein